MLLVLVLILIKRARSEDVLLSHIEENLNQEQTRSIMTSSTTFRADGGTGAGENNGPYGGGMQGGFPDEGYLDLNAKVNPLLQLNYAPSAGYSDAIW